MAPQPKRKIGDVLIWDERFMREPEPQQGDTVIHQPPFPTPAKPEVGSPCNGCGLCCHVQVCMIGQYVYDLPPTAAPCPAIRYIDGQVRCGVVMDEIAEKGEENSMAAKALNIGRGCFMSLELIKKGFSYE